MAVSKSFKALTAVCLVITILPKGLVAGGISNPTPTEIATEVAEFVTGQGYETARASFGGREAVLAIKDRCLMYVIPVAHQGWHQAIIRQALSPSQHLRFVFNGKFADNEQETLGPLSVYYARKVKRYFGFDATYPAVLALVVEDACSVSSISWGTLSGIPFRATTLLD